jgi:zinc protease
LIETVKYRLENGLRLIVHTDRSTPIVAVNLLYGVGSKNEDPSMTGFAHLFEHLMFGGTKNIPDFDRRLEIAGGESNAFTNSDITNYYITVPSTNIETALWLESDRMQGLDLSDLNLKIQKDVVSEEFRQRYLNQPYGDAMMLLRPLVYKEHPYRWQTIGMDLSHIEKAGKIEVESFFKRHYTPSNAILTIAGDISHQKAHRFVQKWFASIPSPFNQQVALPVEPEQLEPRLMIVERPVPANVLYKAWVVAKRGEPEFNVYDMLSDILSGGESGRLYTSLVRDKRVFNEINCYLTGEIDRGMLIVAASLAEGTTFEIAEEVIEEEFAKIMSTPVSEYEYRKVKNRYESEYHLRHTGILAKATALSLHELLGDASLINSDISNYNSVTPENIMEVASKYLTRAKSSTLIYKSINLIRQ